MVSLSLSNIFRNSKYENSLLQISSFYDAKLMLVCSAACLNLLNSSQYLLLLNVPAKVLASLLRISYYFLMYLRRSWLVYYRCLL